jgi:hypothetical protein
MGVDDRRHLPMSAGSSEKLSLQDLNPPCAGTHRSMAERRWGGLDAS